MAFFVLSRYPHFPFHSLLKTRKEDSEKIKCNNYVLWPLSTYSADLRGVAVVQANYLPTKIPNKRRFISMPLRNFMPIIQPVTQVKNHHRPTNLRRITLILERE